MLGNSVAEALHWATSLAEESEQTSSSKFLSEGQGSTRTKVTSTPHMISSSATEALDEDEREFLASILPVRVAAITSENYGSFQDLGDASSESEAYADSDRNTLYQNNGTDASRTGTGTGVGTGLGLGLGLGLGNAWSTDSSCVDATGALTYYLACTRSPETKRLKGDSPKKSLGFHHRRALRGNGTGPMETRTVPFSLAVEEIGCSAQVTVWATPTYINSIDVVQRL